MAFYGFHTVKRPRGTRIDPESKVRRAVEYLAQNPGLTVAFVARKFGTDSTAMRKIINNEKPPVNMLRCPICTRPIRTKTERVQVMNFAEWTKNQSLSNTKK